MSFFQKKAPAEKTTEPEKTEPKKDDGPPEVKVNYTIQ